MMSLDEPEPGEGALAAARELAARRGGVAVSQVELVRTLSGTWIALSDRVVVKVHGVDASPTQLVRRLRLAARPALRGCVLAPLSTVPVPLDGGPPSGGWATVWPRVDPLPQDVAAAPWAQAGRLLARLHRLPLPGPGGDGPVQGAVARLRSALARLEAAVAGHSPPPDLVPAVEVVRQAARRLPGACWDPDGGSGRPRSLVHGDWHLGQLGRLPACLRGEGPDRWRLLDVDDLGLGDPAWDLARPAAFWAAGLMPDADWAGFVEAYRAAGGPAVPPTPTDPWPAVDAVARASLVLAAAGALRRAVVGGEPLEEMDIRLVEVCRRLPGAG